MCWKIKNYSYMKSLAINRKFNKSVAMILLAVIILFDTFYIDYKRSYAAATTAITITIEEALMYLAGVCGVAFTGAYIADHPIPEDKKAIIKESFEECCMEQNISKAEMMEWEHQLIAGQLDKASACWNTFLDCISADITQPVGDLVMPDGTIALDNFISKQELDFNSDFYGDLTVKVSYSDFKSFWSNIPISADIVSIETWKDSSGYFNVDLRVGRLSEKYPKKLYINNGEVVQGTMEEHYSIPTITARLNCNVSKDGSYSLTGRCDVFSETHFRYLGDERTVDFMANYPILIDGVTSSSWHLPTISATTHYPGWNNVLEGGNSLSDYADVIGAGQTADTDVISIPWGNVIDNTGHLESKWEKLWEKLASGEITWEQFIEAVQEGVGTIALEKEATGEIEGEGDDAHPVVIEKEVVPQNPDKPRTKDEIYEDNTLNTSMTFDLKEIFPFCIPWDIYNIFSYLNQEPVAPKFEIPIPSYDKSGKLTFSNTITVDLSMFDSVALVFRVCMFLLFCLGLAIVTRSLIRG